MQESLALKWVRKDVMGMASTLANLGQLAIMQNNVAQALAWHREGLVLRRDLKDWPGLAQSVSHMAEVATKQGQYALAAQLYAAVDVYRLEMNLPLTTGGRADYEQFIAHLKEQLTPTEFVSAQYAGRLLTLTQAAEIALNQIP